MVVEPGAVVGELVVGEDAGDGLAVYLAGPLVVGAVQPGRVGVAAAAGVAAAGHPLGEGAGQGEADLASSAISAAMARRGPAGPGGRHVVIFAAGFPLSRVVILQYKCCMICGVSCRLYRAVAAVVGVGGGGGVRPGRDHDRCPGGAGTGEEPAVGSGKLADWRPARPGPVPEYCCTPRQPTVHPLRARFVAGGAADAADEPAVHRPPGGTAAVSGGPAAPRGRAKAPYSAAEIGGFLALADAQPTAARRARAAGLVPLARAPG